MNCAHNCKHQPCPAPMSCGVGAYPVIDESLFVVNVKYGEQESSNICAGTITKGPLTGLYVVGQPMPTIDVGLMNADTAKSLASSLLYPADDDMTYSGAFQGHGIPLYQANHDGSNPHEAPFSWLDRIREQAINGALVLAIWGVVAAIGIAAGYFVAKLNF